YSLEATAEAIKQLTQRTNDLAILQSHTRPMVVDPLPWAPGRPGGYRFALRGWYPLVRHTPETKETKASDGRLEQVERVTPSVSTVPMPRVYKALNAIQHTAWRINRGVYDFVREIERRGFDLAGIPKKPPARSRNRKRRAAYLKAQRPLDTASAVLDDLKIWFPYSLDFRGRVYAISAYLSPQGDDLSRALLTFSQEKVVDEDGTRWLAIHGANRLGTTPDGQKVSKMTFGERIEW